MFTYLDINFKNTTYFVTSNLICISDCYQHYARTDGQQGITKALTAPECRKGWHSPHSPEISRRTGNCQKHMKKNLHWTEKR